LKEGKIDSRSKELIFVMCECIFSGVKFALLMLKIWAFAFKIDL